MTEHRIRLTRHERGRSVTFNRPVYGWRVACSCGFERRVNGSKADARATADEHWPELDERAEIALLWLVEQEAPAYAFTLAAHFANDHGIGSGRRPDGGVYYRDGDVAGAANTLKALKRRGLAENDGGGAWIQVRWSATERGREVAAGLPG